MKKIIGLDLGGTFIKIGVVDNKGNILDKKELPTPKSREEILNVIFNNIESFLQTHSGEIKGIGIGTPGLVDREGKVFLAPNLPDWSNFNLKKIFEDKFSIQIKVENDVTAFTWGEYKFGAGKGYENIICITLGTGVGGGIILNGKLLRGSQYSAVEIGHMPISYEEPDCKCGNVGCLERYVGSQYIVAMTKEKLKKEKSMITEMVHGDLNKITPEVISEAYHKGDKLAKEIWTEVGVYIGTLFSGLVNLFNPQLIIIGGGVAQVGEVLFSTVKKTIDERSFSLLAKDVKVIPAKLGKDAGIISCASLFLL